MKTKTSTPFPRMRMISTVRYSVASLFGIGVSMFILLWILSWITSLKSNPRIPDFETRNGDPSLAYRINAQESWTGEIGIWRKLSFFGEHLNARKGYDKETKAPYRKTTAVVFSTWVDTPEKNNVRLNVLQTWRLWKPEIIPLLFTDDTKSRQQATKFGWEVQKEPAKACSGVPVFRELFLSAMAAYQQSDFYGFVNGDILIQGDRLLASLQAVAEMPSFKTKPVMVIIERYNVNFTDRPPVHHVENVASIASLGHKMNDGSADGIFTNRLFPWNHVPDLVPGRAGIANWMVAFARVIGADVIDITTTTIAVHMTTKSGNAESRGHKDARCNHKVFRSLDIAPKPSFHCGWISCAEFITVETMLNHVTRYKVERKRRKDEKCSPCKMNVASLMKTFYHTPS